MLSCYFTTIGFYISTLITVLTVYIFLYGRLYLVLSGIEKGLSSQSGIRQNKPLEVALASQSFVQIGFLMALPMMMEIGLEKGFRSAFILMQLQLAPVFSLFSSGPRFIITDEHYFMEARNIGPRAVDSWCFMQNSPIIIGFIRAATL